MSNLLAALFGLALTTAYVPGITGAATTPRWLVASLLAVALFFARRFRLTVTHWIGLILTGYLFLTLLWSEGQQDGIDAAFKLTLAAIAFAIGSTMSDLRPVMIGSVIGIGVSSAIAIAQYWGWHGVETDGGFSGLFVNRDRLAAAAALVTVGAITLRMWPALPLMAPALILPGSRAAWLGVVAGLLLAPMRSVWKWSLGAAALLGGAVTVAARAVDTTRGDRIELWRDTAAALNPFGHGLGSFWESFPAHAHHFEIAAIGSRPEHPHNEWLWLAYEGGWPAFALGMVFALVLWRDADERYRAVLGCLFVLSLVAMPFHDPVTLILGAIVAGYCARDSYDFCDVAVDRGVALQQGMAAGVGQRRAF